MNVRHRLKELQKLAAPLESDTASRAAGLARVAQHAEAFLQDLPTRPVYVAPGDRAESMAAMKLSPSPSSLEHALAVLNEHVDSVGHNLGSSRFFAYIPSGGLYESALADYLAAVSNRYSGVGYASPGATRMEETLIEWLAGVVGYPDTAEGDLTSGGSIAALSAVVAAREAHGIGSHAVSNHVVYLSSQTHHTLRKALRIAGLGDCVVREVPLDSGFRMKPQALREMISSDRVNGLRPWLIAATAGTTDIGAVDPFEEIADIAQQGKLWLHVDAAYGGAFMLCEEGRRRLKGIERSDSLILDPHKGFFLPCGVGAVLVRDRSTLYDAFRARGVYMQDADEDTERSPCDLSPELTRPFRALRFWLPFKVLGTAPFAAALEEKLLLASYFYEQVARIPGIETGPPPDLSIVTFRYLPGGGSADAFNRRLVDALRDDGRILVTSTTIAGRFTIRLAVLGYNTHLDAVDTALTAIKEKIAELCQT